MMNIGARNGENYTIETEPELCMCYDTCHSQEPPQGEIYYIGREGGGGQSFARKR